MADSLPVYSAREVSVAWGLILMDGFSSDNIVSFAYNTDLTTETIGADGKLATSVTPDRSGTVTVELMQTSNSTKELAALLAYQNNQSDTSAIIKADFAVSDPSGSTLWQGTHEWVLYSEKIDFLPTPRGVEDVALAAESAAIVAGMVAQSQRS